MSSDIRNFIGLAHAYMLMIQSIGGGGSLSPNEELTAQKRLKLALCSGALQGFALRGGDTQPIPVGNPRAFNVPTTFLSSLFNTGRVPMVRGKPIMVDAILPYVGGEFLVDRIEFDRWLSIFAIPAEDHQVRESAGKPSSDLILIPNDAAEFLRISPRTLEHMRMTGTGPRYTRMSARRIGYRQSDIEAWLDANTRTSTSEERLRPPASASRHTSGHAKPKEGKK